MQTQAALKVFFVFILCSRGGLYSMDSVDSAIPEGNTFFSVLTVIQPPSPGNPYFQFNFTLPRPKDGGPDIYFLRHPDEAVVIHSVTANGKAVMNVPSPQTGSMGGGSIYDKIYSLSTQFSNVQYPAQARLKKFEEKRLEILNRIITPPIKDEPYYMLYGTSAVLPRINRVFLIPQNAHTIEIIYSGVYHKKGKGFYHGAEKYRLVLSNKDILNPEKEYVHGDPKEFFERRRNAAEKKPTSEGQSDGEELSIESGKEGKPDARAGR